MPDSNFFDFLEERQAKDSPRKPAQSPPMTVSQLTAVIGRAIKSGVPGTQHVRGEVSNFNHHRASGHFYFTLKDATACIDCVMFRSDAARLKFTPEDGHELVASGRVDIYPARGRYQLYVTSLHPVGRGALELAFRQLHEKLASEGLFAAERKRPIPQYPRHVALVTSRQTAALQDMLKVLRRFPWVRVGIYHVAVQGDGAAEQIAAAIEQISRAARRAGIELMILARGGGSLEDLWEFNEEVVARAVAASAIPVVTGIGHEVDTSIADLVADYHAHTPTEAAQVIMSNWRSAADAVRRGFDRLHTALRRSVIDLRRQMALIEQHEFFRRPTDRINRLRQLLDDRQRALAASLGRVLRRDASRAEKVAARLLQRHPRHAVQLAAQKLQTARANLHRQIRLNQESRARRLEALAAQLEALAPPRVLARGYSITSLKKSGAIVRAAADVKPGDVLLTRLSDGQVESVARDGQASLFE